MLTRVSSNVYSFSRHVQQDIYDSEIILWTMKADVGLIWLNWIIGRGPKQDPDPGPASSLYLNI